MLDDDVEPFLKRFKHNLCHAEVRDFYQRVLQMNQTLEGILLAVKDRLAILRDECTEN